MSIEYPDLEDFKLFGTESPNLKEEFCNREKKHDKPNDKIVLNTPNIDKVCSKIPLLKDTINIINNCPNVKIEEFNCSNYSDDTKYVKLRLDNKTKRQNDLKIRFYINGHNDKYYEINDLQFDKSEIKKFIKILNILSER